MPPGDANALTPSVSRTMNCQSRFGRELRLRQNLSDQRHVPGDVLVLIDAEVLSELRADLFAELAFVGVGDLDFRTFLSTLLLASCACFSLSPRPAELRVGRRRRHSEAHQCHAAVISYRVIPFLMARARRLRRSRRPVSFLSRRHLLAGGCRSRLSIVRGSRH